MYEYHIFKVHHDPSQEHTRVAAVTSRRPLSTSEKDRVLDRQIARFKADPASMYLLPVTSSDVPLT